MFPVLNRMLNARGYIFVINGGDGNVYQGIIEALGFIDEACGR